MIPKIIHFVWVGDKEKPELVLKCMESWKKHCPDYQIVEWNNDSLKTINNLYVSQAFERKKWAFVSDYLRLYALYNYGGFYCDSDLEIVSNIDQFREHDFVTGYEGSGKKNCKYSPITAFMGANKGNKIVKDLLDEYNEIPFVKDGVMNQLTNTQRISNYFSKNFKLKKPYDGTQKTMLTAKSLIYPYYYFCTPKMNKESYAIHHFSGSWLDPYTRKTYFNLLGYKIVRFKKRPTVPDDYLPLNDREKVIWMKEISKIKKLCILKNM